MSPGQAGSGSETRDSFGTGLEQVRANSGNQGQGSEGGFSTRGLGAVGGREAARGFQDRRLKPLGHLSDKSIYQNPVLFDRPCCIGTGSVLQFAQYTELNVAPAKNAGVIDLNR